MDKFSRDNPFNSMSFSPEDMKAGLHKELIDYLVNYHLNQDDRFNDIHLTTDGFCLIVEWEQVPYDHSYGGSFRYVDEDSDVMRRVDLPDGSWEYIYEDDDPNQYLHDWLVEHPGWTKDDYGHWVFKEG